MATQPEQPARQKSIDAAINSNGAAMRKILITARDRIEKEILTAVKTGDLKNAAWLRDNLYKRLREEYSTLQRNMDGWTRDATTEVAKEWTQYAVDDIPGGNYEKAWSRFSKTHLEKTIQQYSPTAMMDRAAVNAGNLSPAYGGMLTKDIDILRQVVEEKSVEQALTGMTAAQWRKEVQAEIEKRSKTWAFIDEAGKTWTANNYFNMLNRTLAAETARETYQVQMADSGHDLATIEGGIPPNCCDDCLAWAGKIVSVSGTSKEYPALKDAYDGGVFHPRCRHYLAVVLPGEEEEAKAEEERQRQWAKDNGFPLTKSKVAPDDVKPTKKEPKPAAEVKAPTITPAADARMKLAEISKEYDARVTEADKKYEEKRVQASNFRVENESKQFIALRDARARHNIPYYFTQTKKRGGVEYITTDWQHIPDGDPAKKEFQKYQLKKNALEADEKHYKQLKNDLVEERRRKQHEAILLPKSEAGTNKLAYKSPVFVGERKELFEQGANFTARFMGKTELDNYEIPIEPKTGSRSSHYRGTLNMVKGAGPSSAAHEMGHAYEYRDPTIQAKAQAFLFERNNGEKIQRLNTLYGGGFDSYEVACRDKWKDPYCGKLYMGEYVHEAQAFASANVNKAFDKGDPKYSNPMSTEIVSMGLEKLYIDPAAFQAEEPEYFDFMMNKIRGGGQ